jgi:hypothetical protein
MSEDWPNDFSDVMMIALPKKIKHTNAVITEMITLISYIGKVVACLLSKRLESRIEEFLEDQFEFQKDKGTIDAIGYIRITSAWQ